MIGRLGSHEAHLVELFPGGVVRLSPVAEKLPQKIPEELHLAAVKLASCLSDKALADKVSLCTSIVATFEVAVAVACVSAKPAEEKTCSEEHVKVLVNLRRHARLSQVALDTLAVQALDDEKRLSLPFRLSSLCADLEQQCRRIGEDLVGTWKAEVADLIRSVNAALPPWQPVQAELLTHPVGTQLTNTDFQPVSAMSSRLDTLIKLFRMLNTECQGTFAVPVQLLKDMQTSKSFAVDSICIAFAIAQWHTNIKTQPNHMQRCKLLSELLDALKTRGSSLPPPLLAEFQKAMDKTFPVDAPAGDRAEPADAEEPKPIQKRRRKV